MIKGFFIGEEKHVAILSIIFGVYKLRFHRFCSADCFRKRKSSRMGCFLCGSVWMSVCHSRSVGGVFAQVAPFKPANSLYPFRGHRHGFMLFQVKDNHNRFAYTFNFTRSGVDDPLYEVKTFRSDLRYGCLYGYLVGRENLFDKIGFDMHLSLIHISEPTRHVP